MKKISVALIVLLVLLSECGKKPVTNGTVGSPVDLMPVLKKTEDTVACTFKWVFNTKPAESSMDVLSFQPDSRSFAISFVPDVPGDYEVQFSSLNADGKEQFAQVFACVITQDTSQTPATDSGGYQIPAKDLSAPLPQYTKPGSQSVPAAVYQSTQAAKPKPRAVVKGRRIPKVPGKYTIQISSWKSYNQAEAALSKLAAGDLDAYIQKAYFQETKETWYRIRSGTFDSYDEAKGIMKDLQSRFPKEHFWIDFVREDL